MYIANSSCLMVADDGSFHTDASEMGLKPGEWPGQIQFESSCGNDSAITGIPFVLDIINDDLARYMQLGGSMKVIVWND